MPVDSVGGGALGMTDREGARRAAVTHVPRNARPQPGLAGAQPREARSFAAAGGRRSRSANRAARGHHTGNCGYFSGKMTRAADGPDA